VLQSYPFRLSSDTFWAEQGQLRSFRISSKEVEKLKPEGSGSGSQVVVVAVHRNTRCFDVFIPKL
jgi:hypothetical protein